MSRSQGKHQSPTDREAGKRTSLDKKLASGGVGASQNRALRSRKVGSPSSRRLSSPADPMREECYSDHVRRGRACWTDKGRRGENREQQQC